MALINTRRCSSEPQRNAASAWAIRLVLLLGALVLVSARPAKAVELSDKEMQDRRCLNCHAQTQIGELARAERASMVAASTQPLSDEPSGPRAGLHVSDLDLAKSVHATVACADCHKDARDLPHRAKLASPDCNSCHAKAAGDFAGGAHAAAAAAGEPAPTCSTCHGTHDILPKSQREARTHPLNIIKICADCHEKFSNGHAENGATRVGKYMASVHGKALMEGGLAVAATCADCHGAHRVLPSSNPASKVAKANIPGTCGVCHVGVAEQFATSIHGELLASGSADAPVCTSCHTAHSISQTETSAFKLDIINECGTCHDKPIPGSGSKASLYETYRRSYHGQVTALQSTRAALCSSCHGSHNIRRISDPKSQLYGDHRIDTCRQCHPSANAKFAMFAPHADHRNAQRFPVLHAVWLYFMIMMSFAFGFFGLHSVLWLGRSIVERIKHGPHPKHVANPHAIQRFNRVDRVNHAFVIISFFGLTVTGLPLLYSATAWGQTLAQLVGGVRTAGLLHRFFAVMLIGNFIVHGVGVFRRIRKYGLRRLIFGPTTMLPRVKDVRDCLGMFRWFFRGGSKPAFDRWTYWEKFDYVAEVGGSAIIGLTGLMLWFPEFFSRFLPGWSFNIATVVHGYEAMLAIGFIFTIHFFNAHLRLEKFPVDDVIFTGRLPEAEFREERGDEYARLVASGELEALKVRPASRWYRVLAVTAGIIAMTIGTTLVVLIIWAGLKAV